MTNFKNKNILIAGGSGLIGSALVAAFRDQGATVTNADITGGDITFDCACLNDSGTAQLLSEARPDVFVNCIYPKDDHRKHLDGFLWMTWKVAEWMKQQYVDRRRFAEMSTPRMADDNRAEWETLRDRTAHWNGGTIVNFSSIYGGVLAHDPGRYAGTKMYDQEEWLTYSAVKGGVVALTRTLAVEYAPFNVRVNCISPGGVYDNQPEVFVDKYCRAVPMGRMAKPEDLVGPVLFLAGEASGYVTGQNVIVDGGLSCW